MSEARIYQPAKNAMQSGRGKTRRWILEYELAEPRVADPLMGWIGSGDTNGQLRLKFDSKEEAVDYAEKNGLIYRVIEPKARRVKPKSYSDNFAFDRVGVWTH
ncbi:MAG: ETC complex I subunit [Rhodospirillaceae bacterium]